MIQNLGEKVKLLRKRRNLKQEDLFASIMKIYLDAKDNN